MLSNKNKHTSNEENVFSILNPKLKSVIQKYGYLEPTKVQSKAIPLILKGYNILIVAPTGAGKTEAALFPIYSKIIEENFANGIQALYITPLRALNRDILVRMGKIAKDIGLNIAVRHGDTTYYFRRKIAENPPHLLITTPETLHYLLVHAIMRKVLKSIKWVVVDEVNELMGSKRGVILSVALERLVKLCGREFQRIGLSAVIGNVEAAKRFLGGPRYVEVVEVYYQKPYEIIVEVPQPTSEDEIIALREGISPSTMARLRRIVEILEKSKSGIVFTNTRDLAELLSSRLKRTFNIDVGVHHGSLSRNVRLTLESEFKQGIIRYVVATSSLELGIDVGEVDVVIQYGSPRQATKLLQRIGRSGHRETEKSKGYVIALANVDDALESLVLARRVIDKNLESESTYENPLDVIVYETAGLLLEYGEISVDEVFKILRRSFYYRKLSYATLIETLNFASAIGVISFDGKILRKTRRTKIYYYDVSMIPDVRHFLVKNIIDNTIIGQLDEDFVISSLNVGAKFLLSGKVWETLDYDEKYVYVKPAEDSWGALPKWEGELIPVDYKVSREVGALKRRIIEKGLTVLRKYPTSQSLLNFIEKQIKEHYSKMGWIPTDREVVVEIIGGKNVIVNSHLGSKGNFGLMLLLTYFLRKRGVNVVSKSDPYRVVLMSNSIVHFEEIINDLISINNEDLKYLLRENIKKSNVFKWRLYNVAKRFGAIRKDVSVKKVSNILAYYVDTPIGYEAFNEIIVDKIDLNAIFEFIDSIRKGRVKVKFVYLEDYSPLTMQALTTYSYYDVSVKLTPMGEIIELFKRRVVEKRVKLVCLMCGSVIDEVKIADLPDYPKCNICGSGFLTITSTGSRDVEIIVRKMLRKLRLNPAEKAMLREEKLKADLVLRFGKPAIIALSTFGVGYKTAARIVGKFFENESEFYKALIEAETLFIRTRRFWKS